ncbi:transmembrane protein 169-like [Mizuhopecten yessoensis]|uniref:Transmembrane protein 169 n=1 Tax=Mizuhopecten yessoensis TaxID=6573 RepID=A0A210PVV1_MIZYE|nr:transmembrane protein 169-like [Mizuhopecten yessoensis]XP_021373974.1 transmembrane protein 169-like [Mizuhopecten yessoensis]OWF40599.1 Transmembrane protein 169 [Mizuhopecten yessoensis]
MENSTEDSADKPKNDLTEQQSKLHKSSLPLTDIPEDPTEDRNSRDQDHNLDEDVTKDESKNLINSKNVRSKGDNLNTSSEIIAIESTDIEMEPMHLPSSNNENDEESSEFIGKKSGPHVVLFSVICIPAAFIASMCVAFYYGASSWYNLYIYFSEEKSIWHKVSICPVLILTFPFTVGLSSIGVAFFAAFVQLSWFYLSWHAEFLDFEKGFYGWLCNKIGLPQCCPYELIILNNESELEPMRTAL